MSHGGVAESEGLDMSAESMESGGDDMPDACQSLPADLCHNNIELPGQRRGDGKTYVTALRGLMCLFA